MEFEFRSSDWKAGENETIEGYAIVFESKTCLYTDPETGLDYNEIIDRGALESCDLKDVVLRYNHEGNVLARTRNKSLKLNVDSRGLHITADMSLCKSSREIYESVKAGLLDKMSFQFSVAPDGDEYDAKTRTRRIKSIQRVMDVSVVDFPAYEQTSVHARGKFEAFAEPDRRAYLISELRSKIRTENHGDPEDFGVTDPRWNPIGKTYDMDTLEDWDIRCRLAEIAHCAADGNLNALQAEADTLIKERHKRAERRQKAIDAILRGEGKVIAEYKGLDNLADDNDMKGTHTMEKNKLEVRAFQKYIATGTMSTLDAEERAALTTAGAGAVLPLEIANEVITSEKYSDLLHRANVFNESGAGTLRIPIASANSAAWKAEGASGTDASPTLTYIDLKGSELFRATQFSAAVEAMTEHSFIDFLADLVSSETVDALENAFVNGDSTNGDPHNGLENLTYTSANSVTIASGSSITAADVAEGLSKLPQKYARNAIILCNANTLYNTVSLFKGTDEYAYNVADGATKLFGKELVVSEYVADDTIYIVDPRQLYVRFARPIAVETDRSSGFMSATSAIRCLAVVDYAWNEKACVKIA